MAGETIPESRIGLAEAIRGLRAELTQAQREGKNQDLRFTISEIEVELALEFGTTKEIGGGLKVFSFLDLSGKAGANDKTGHTIRLKLGVGPEFGTISDDAGPARVTKEADK